MANEGAINRLATGTIVYMIGNMMSKILQMLILPIITAALVTSEYGYSDEEVILQIQEIFLGFGFPESWDGIHAACGAHTVPARRDRGRREN